MARSEQRMEALAQIRSDLGQLRRRRALALATYVALLLVFFAVLFVSPAKHGSLARNGAWAAALLLLFVGSTAATALALGIPLVRRKILAISGALAAVAIGAGLLINSNAGAPIREPILSFGLPCFLFGTAVSIGALMLLGALSGRLWRRFPDPGLVMAVGLTSVGITALHFRCGGVEPIHLIGFHLTPLLLVYLIARFAVRLKERLLQDG